ncbi:hypothetical protein ACWDU8_30045, partial [Streptomyces sp. NPDC003388]
YLYADGSQLARDTRDSKVNRENVSLAKASGTRPVRRPARPAPRRGPGRHPRSPARFRSRARSLASRRDP